MPNVNELKSSMSGMRDRISDEATKAHAELDKIIASGDGSFKDAALKAKEYITNAFSHFEAYVQTAMVAADAQPTRTAGAAQVPGRGNMPRAPQAAEPVKLSGVPATPPGGPHNVSGPAVTHDDVGYRDPMTGVDRAAPAATGEKPHEVGDMGTEGSVADEQSGKL